MKRVLLVDDDATIHQLVGAIIQIMGDIAVESCYNGQEALDSALANPPDLIIADVSMPVLDGLQLTQLVRQSEAIADTSILLLTGRTDTQDKYLAFLQGADDYLVKPFDATELQLRIRALLRRAGRRAADESHGLVVPRALLAGPLELSPARLTARAKGLEIQFTASEFAILRHMATHPEQVVSVEALLSQALDYPAGTGNPQVIHTHVKNIRAKLRQVGVVPDFLSSSRLGYMLVAGNELP